jgi:hypothetical protein
MMCAGLKKWRPITRPGRFCGDGVDVQRGSVRAEQAVRLCDRVERPEDFLFERHALEDRLDDHVRGFEAVIAGLWTDAGHTLLDRLGRELAALDGAVVASANGRQSLLGGRGTAVGEDHLHAGVGARHRDAGAHRARADDADGLERRNRGVLADAGHLGHGALGEESMDQRLCLRRLGTAGEQLGFTGAALVERQRRRRLDRVDRRVRCGLVRPDLGRQLPSAFEQGR